LSVIALALLGFDVMGFLKPDDLLPREHDRITGASVVMTAIGTILLAAATAMLFFVTQKLAKATQLSIATDAPLISFELSLDDPPPPQTRQGPAPDHKPQAYFPQDHDSNYRDDFREEDAVHGLWQAGSPIQYARLTLSNVQTKPYSAARQIAVRLYLQHGGASEDAEFSALAVTRTIPLTVLAPGTTYKTPAFNVGGLGRFRLDVTFLEYRDLHSRILRRAGWGTGYLARSIGGRVDRVDVVSRPTKHEVPA